MLFLGPPDISMYDCMAHGSRKYRLVWCVLDIVKVCIILYFSKRYHIFLGVFWVLGNATICRVCLVMPSVRDKGTDNAYQMK